MSRRVTVHRERWPLARPFTIAGVTEDASEVIVATIEDGASAGRGEASGVYYRGETVETMASEIDRIRPAIEAGADRAALHMLLPPGGARNALDCALWALEARQRGVRPADLAGVAMRPLVTATTIGIDHPDVMAAQAAALAAFRILKVKVDAEAPLARVAAVRKARPDAILTIDANGSWTISDLRRHAPRLADLDVRLIEQPVAPRDDAELSASDSPIPLCADESCQSLDDLARLPSAYGAVCLKLDKAGGLTEALAMAHTARARSLRTMVSNMVGTSLGMAPALLVGALCDLIDLDGPLLLARDRSPGLSYRDDEISPAGPEVWA